MALGFRIGLVTVCALLSGVSGLSAAAQTVRDRTDDLQLSGDGRVQSPFFEVALPVKRTWHAVSLKPTDAGFTADIGAGRTVFARVASFQVEHVDIRVGPKPGADSSLAEEVKWIADIVDRKSAVAVQLIIAQRTRLKADGGTLLFFHLDKNLSRLEPRGYCNSWSAMSIDSGVPGLGGRDLRTQHRGRVCFDTSSPAMVSLRYSERRPQALEDHSEFGSEARTFLDSLKFKPGE